MKKTTFILSLMVALLFASGIGSAFGAVAGAVAFGATMVAKNPTSSLMMSVTPEIWTDYIVGNLFKTGNDFILDSIDESQYVIGCGVVHIPQAGSPAGVKRNRQSLPATITRRKDVDVTYVLDEFTTDPRLITNIEQVELSYDKMESCMSEDMSYLRQILADSMLYNWKPKYFIKASSEKAAKNRIHGTGLRTGVCTDDFEKAKTIFNKWGIPEEDRFVILPTEMYSQLCNDVRKATQDNLSAVYNPVTGKLEALEGFKIRQRQTVLLASNSTLTAVSGNQYFKWTSADLTYTPEDYEDIVMEVKDAAATSCCVGLFWSKSKVARAIGVTEMFDDKGNPLYYGDIYSFLQRMGGRLRRGDAKGVLGIIQEYSAS